VLLLSAAMLAAAGCASSSPPETPAGTDAIVITANSVNGVGATTQQLTLSVVVTQ
jgi:hypothetical protein